MLSLGNRLYRKLLVALFAFFCLVLYFQLIYNTEGPYDDDDIVESKVQVNDITRAATLEDLFVDRTTALKYLDIAAKKALRNTSVFSVTLKPESLIPKGASKHDYVSLSKYYWPDPAKPDGLPWIRVDGKVNPVVDSVKDYKYFRAMSDAVRTLANAYYYNGNEEYAKKAIQRIEEWFMNDDTKMNPNVNYGSMRTGSDTGLGSQQGILDIWPISRVLGSIPLLRRSPHYTAELQASLSQWISEYISWLDASPLADIERRAPNNHGTYYDIQYLSLLRFLNSTDRAKEVITKQSFKRIYKQINATNGEMIHELRRPTSWYYSVFNLQALFLLAQEIEPFGYDLYSLAGRDGQSIRKALDYLVPFARWKGTYGPNGEDWPRVNIGGWEVKNFLGVLQVASVRWKNSTYFAVAKELRKRVYLEEKGLSRGALVDEWLCNEIEKKGGYNGTEPTCKFL